MTKRCTLVVPDAGPFNSLWVADELPLLLRLNMKVIVVDAVYDELTRDPANYVKDRDVADFIGGHGETFKIETTTTGRREREDIQKGKAPSRNAGEVAIVDFMSDGLEKYLASGDPVLVLFEDSDVPNVRFFRKPPHLHLLSTVSMLKGLERVGVVRSADEIIRKMTNPTDPTRKPRVFNDLSEGIDEPAAIGSTWTP